MGSGADLFVVCKHCGSEVSPYVTECPYCGNRIRRRAPKLPRPDERVPEPHREPRDWAASRPWVSLALVAAGAVMYILVHAEPRIYIQAAILGPLHGDWWRLLTAPFVYASGGYAFVALVSLAIFGTAIERSRGPVFAAGLFLAAALAGGLVELALGQPPIAAGANGAALAMLTAWLSPQLLGPGERPEAPELIGSVAVAALLFAVSAVITEASWLAGLTGALIGIPLGVGAAALSRERSGL